VGGCAGPSPSPSGRHTRGSALFRYGQQGTRMRGAQRQLAPVPVKLWCRRGCGFHGLVARYPRYERRDDFGHGGVISCTMPRSAWEHQHRSGTAAASPGLARPHPCRPHPRPSCTASRPRTRAPAAPTPGGSGISESHDAAACALLRRHAAPSPAPCLARSMSTGTGAPAPDRARGSWLWCAALSAGHQRACNKLSRVLAGSGHGRPHGCHGSGEPRTQP